MQTFYSYGQHSLPTKKNNFKTTATSIQSSVDHHRKLLDTSNSHIFSGRMKEWLRQERLGSDYLKFQGLSPVEVGSLSHDLPGF